MATYVTKYNERLPGAEAPYLDDEYEVGAVEPGFVYLQEVPLPGSVEVTDFTGVTTFTEVTDPAAVLGPTEYRVAYEGAVGAGRVEFSGALDGDIVLISSLGTGSGLYAHDLNALATGKADLDGSRKYTGPLLPAASVTHALGSAAFRWNNVYSGGGDFAGNVTVGGTFGVTGLSTFTNSVSVGIGVIPDAALRVTLATSTAVLQYGLLQQFVASAAATTAYGVYSAVRTQAVAFTLANAYALYAADAAKGAGSAITNAYGLYVQNITAGVNNWSIWTNNGKARFGETVLIGRDDVVTTTTNALLQVGGSRTGVVEIDFRTKGNSQLALWFGNEDATGNGRRWSWYTAGNTNQTAFALWCTERANDAISFRDTGWVYITKSLGIGTASVDASYALDVGGTMRVTGTMDVTESKSADIARLFIKNSAASANGNKARLALGPHSGFAASIAPYVEAYDDGAGDTGLAFGTYRSATGGLGEHMRINGAGALVMAGLATSQVTSHVAGEIALARGKRITFRTGATELPIASDPTTDYVLNVNTDSAVNSGGYLRIPRTTVPPAGSAALDGVIGINESNGKLFYISGGVRRELLGA